MGKRQRRHVPDPEGEARAAVERSRAALEQVEAQAGPIRALVRHLKAERERNHFGAMIEQAMSRTEERRQQ